MEPLITWPEGNVRVGGGDIFCLLHGSVLSMSRSAAAASAAALRLLG